MRDKFAILWAALAALLFVVSPASATTLATLAITTAQAAQAGTGNCAGASATCTAPLLQLNDEANSVSVQCKFTYGSGGTSADVWVQTSFDGGLTWIDVAECGFLLANATKIYNLSSLTPVTTVYVPTDGSLGANTSKDGLIGAMWRVKYTTVGTYAGGTTLSVDITTNRVRAIR